MTLPISDQYATLLNYIRGKAWGSQEAVKILKGVACMLEGESREESSFPTPTCRVVNKRITQIAELAEAFLNIPTERREAYARSAMALVKDVSDSHEVEEDIEVAQTDRVMAQGCKMKSRVSSADSLRLAK